MLADFLSPHSTDESFVIFLTATDRCDATHLFEAISKLSASELLRFSSIKSKFKKREFLLSRLLLASSLLNFYHVEEYYFLSVQKTGKPFFGTAASKRFHLSISISHAEGVLALGVYRRPISNYVQSVVDIGIDIQPLGSIEAPEAFIRFLRIPSQPKRKNLYASQYFEQLTLRWVLAEACLKTAAGKTSDLRNIIIEDDAIRTGFSFIYPHKMMEKSTGAWCYIHRGISCCVVAGHAPLACKPILYYSNDLVGWVIEKTPFTSGIGKSI
jgi:phosphopantetheinyl transferase